MDVLQQESAFFRQIENFQEEKILKKFFKTAKYLLEHFQIASGDNRITFSVREAKSATLPILVAGKQVLKLTKKAKKYTIAFLVPRTNLEQYKSNPAYMEEEFLSASTQNIAEAPLLIHFKLPDFEMTDFIQSQWFEAVQKELNTHYKSNQEKNNEYFYKAVINAVYQKIVLSNTKETKYPQMPLNQILYGPPGTGKTFSVVEQTLQIMGKPIGSPEENMKEFNLLKNEGRVEFVTFHQSFSYEEFIEGIRAKTENGLVSYQIEDGIFKNIAVEAGLSWFKSLETEAETYESFQDGIISFTEVYQAYLEGLRAQLPKAITTITQKKLFIERITEWGNLSVKYEGKDISYTISKKHIELIYQTDKTPEHFQKGNMREEIRKITGTAAYNSEDWAVYNDFYKFYHEFIHYQLTSNIDDDYDNQSPKFAPQKDFKPDIISRKELYLSYLEKFLNGDFEIHSSPNTPNYVLIIDEINRANISKVFGELIALLETSKRLGETDQLTTKLPYSKEIFGIPPNLYVIGTMNTSDRSIASMDMALRRRFEFLEICPNPSLLSENCEGVDLRALLEKINQRIEFLYDREHQIGHAYLLDVESMAGLSLVFTRKIIPLLQEYFYDDWEKICLVLSNKQGGCDFLEKRKLSKHQIFGNINTEELLDDKIMYRVLPIEKLQNPEIYKNIYA